MTVQDRIEIPESAILQKPWFDTFPDDELVKEIREFVSQTGKPYLWRGHTHTAPQPGSHLQYVEEFSLPRTCKARKTWSPCPCCLPEFPKYKTGKIAWFPDEKIIRLIGPDCYARLDEEGHKKASDALRKRRKERQDIDYLLKFLPSIGRVRSAVDGLVPIAQASDEFFPRLRDRIENVLQIRLWNSIRTGELAITEILTEHYRDSDGKERERRVPNTRRYASIKGIEALDPKRSLKASRAARLLERLDDVRLKANVNELDSAARRELVMAIGRIAGDADRLFGELRRELQFLRAQNFRTLRTWARLTGAPIRIFLELEPDAVTIGRHEAEKHRVPFDTNILQALPQLPRLPRVKAA